ncbi:efflux RND transporter permease subunit [Algihabitans albus]|uniref:efflux RND transporter permease subunit n=1 Tax=Algihabitans albus TaxID=2164067 RepID=UPI000E5D0F3B|nr:MMPL family transporter [Algihabitans albus]
MQSIGFGAERLGLVAVRHPWFAVALSLGLFALSFGGVLQLRFTDDTWRVFSGDNRASAAYERLRTESADAADGLFLVVEGDFAAPEVLQDFSAFADRVAALPSIADVATILSLAELGDTLELAAGPGFETELAEAAPGPPVPAELAVHPLSQGLLLSRDLSLAAIALDPVDDLGEIENLRRLRREVTELAASAPSSLTAQLSGLPVARSRVIDALVREQPLLLGLGLAIGFLCGVLLLGRFADALVIASVPVFTVTAAYGIIGLAGLKMTVLLNNLPLLILALGFATSMHLVYDARRRLYDTDYAFTALRSTVLKIGPACALSVFTTMLAFLSFEVSGSDAIREFGRIGAVSVFGVFVASMLVHPAAVFVALRLGWRPLPTELGDSRLARRFQTASAFLAKRQLLRRRSLLIVGLALLLIVGYGSSRVTPGYSALEQIPPTSQTYRLAQTVEDHLGGIHPIQLPLPVFFAEAQAPLQALVQVRRVHEAVEAAFPERPLLSMTSVIRWLEAEGLSAGSATLRRLFEVAPPLLGNAVVSSDGGHAMITLWARERDDIGAVAAELEATAGAVLERDLTGQASGLAVLSARSAPLVIERLQLSLILAAVGASVLMALAFRSAAVFPLCLLPNLLPVLAVGALLAALDIELTLATALAMTVALGIAVDDTVHMTSAALEARRSRSSGEAVIAAARSVGPVLIVTTVVLTVGLSPALFSWSPATAAFAAFAIATIGLALVADLGLLPALLGVYLARRRDRPDS